MKRNLSIILVALALLMAPAASYTQEPIVAGYIPVLPFSALFVAQEKGYFKEQGLNVKLDPLPSGRDILVMVSAGEYQVGGGAVGSAAFNGFVRGLDFKVVGTLHGLDPKGPSVDPIMVRKKAVDAGEVKTIADLKGKKCAINAIGVATEYMLDRALRKGGLTLADIDLVTMPFPDMVPALDRGAIVCGLLPEPLSTKAEDAGIAVRFIPDYAPGMQVTVLYYNKKFMERRRVEAERFMVAYLKAIRDLQGDGWRSDENAAIINKYTKVPVPLIKKAVPPYWDPNGAINIESIKDQQVFLMRRGHLAYKELINVANMIDASFIEKAVKTLGPFRR